jgi:hypothetical protein
MYLSLVLANRLQRCLTPNTPTLNTLEPNQKW